MSFYAQAALTNFTLYLACIVVFFAQPSQSEEHLSSLPDPLPRQYSLDGNGLLQGVPVRTVLNDPNPQPQRALRRLLAPDSLVSSPQLATSSFSITYVTSGNNDAYGTRCYSFPNSAKNSLMRAADIWATILQSSVPISISACWANLGDSSVLGYSGAGTFRRNFSGASFSNTWYAAALANALAGRDLDPWISDMHITFNTNFNWYFGLDANPGSNQHDFVTVSLHEIGHGLNFSGLMDFTSSSGMGSWGFETGSPSIYDLFVRDQNGIGLTNTNQYPNPSTALGNALTSNNIWFHGSEAISANNGARVKIYAPSTWNPGSSYSHLDYSTFNNTSNQLMVFAISPGEAIHDPGSITRGLLRDLGWQTVSAQNLIPAPSNVTASDGKCLHRILLSWSESTDADTYTIYRCTNSSNNSCTPIHTTASTHFQDLEIVTGRKYYYRLRAQNSSSTSSFSSYDTGFSSNSGINCSPISPIFPLLLD